MVVEVTVEVATNIKTIMDQEVISMETTTKVNQVVMEEAPTTWVMAMMLISTSAEVMGILTWIIMECSNKEAMVEVVVEVSLIKTIMTTERERTKALIASEASNFSNNPTFPTSLWECRAHPLNLEQVGLVDGQLQDRTGVTGNKTISQLVF